MLEATLEPRKYSARIKLDTTASYIQRGGSVHYPLPCRSAVMAKRLLWLQADAHLSVKIELPDALLINRTDITHFRIARLTRNFFLSRLYKKLGLTFDVNQAHQLPDTHLTGQWQQYDRLFQPTHRHLGLHQIVGAKTPPIRMLDPNEQLQDILRLLAQQR